ncbi:MAG TPA: PIN domain-containing protein [Candidatus Saccharimonadales bacterium]|jgi:predicted nucleic acid-binding protein
MAKNDSIFVDSNYLIALYNPADSQHSRALRLAEQISEEDPKLYTSNYILIEVLTVLSQRVDKNTAISVGEHIRDSQQIEILHVNEELDNLIWKIFKVIQSKNVSVVDCSTLALLNYAGIKRLLTFDETDFKPLRDQFSYSIV